LEKAARHVRKGEELIAELLALIRLLECQRHMTAAAHARELLATVKAMQRAAIDHPRTLRDKPQQTAHARAHSSASSPGRRLP
jgi:hypothetical protein